MTTPYPQTPGDRREDHAQAVADTIAAVYESAELVIIATIASLARKVTTGSMLPVTAKRRLNQAVSVILARIRPSVERALGQAAGDTASVVSEAARDVTAGMGSGTVPAVTASDAASALDVILPDALGAAETTAQKSAASALTSVIQAAIGSTRGGAPFSSLSLSRVQAAQKALDDLGEHGITGFTDKAGRNWDLASYVEMATRTAVSNMWDDLLAKAAQRSGLDLVFTYTHSTEGSCPLCIPWLGRILSLSGSAEGYPSLADAKAAGFRHPNCRCSWRVLGAGGMQDVTNPVPDDQAAEVYAASQKQRALERHVRTAQRRANSAITPQARSRSRRELAAARTASAQHRQASGLRITKAAVRRRESLGAR